MTKIQHPSQEERDAARRYLEHDHAAQTLHGKAAAQANRHASQIDEKYSRARDIALTGTVREFGKLPDHLRRHQINARRNAGINTEQAAQIRHEYRTTPNPDHETEAQPKSETVRIKVSNAASTAGSAVASTAGAAADTGWGELIGDLFMGGMALSIGYLVLTRAGALGKVFEGATKVTRAVISPVVDPLNPKGALL